MIVEAKRLLPEVRRHKKYLSVIVVSGILYAATYSRLGLIVRDLFDHMSNAKNASDFKIDEIVKTCAIGLALAITAGVGRYFHNYYTNNLGDLVAISLREQLHAQFMDLSLTFHNSYSAGSGGLLSRTMHDIFRVQEGLKTLADMIVYPFLLMLLIGNLFYLDAKLAAFSLITLPIISVFLRNISKSLRKYIPISQEQLEQMTSTIKESLDGVRIIQSFNLKSFLVKKLQSQAGDFYRVRKKINSRLEISGPVTELIATILFLATIVYTSQQIHEGNATIGSFMGFLTSLLMAGQPIKKFQDSFVRAQQVVVSLGRIFSIIDSKETVKEVEKPLKFPANWSSLRYEKVSFRYGKELVLKDFNLQIRRGEVIALVGESGSGKSTIVNLLERFFDPASGDIFIDSTSIREFELKDLRDHIALVSQDVFLFSDSVKTNIHSGNFSRDPSQISRVAELAHADGFISKMPQKYESRVGDRGNLLSGGEKQRISIARAFFKDAPILILDEATSALDSASEVEVQDGLNTLMEGRTVIIVAHRLSTVQRADRIVVLKKGSIVEVGRHSELLQNGGEYAKFFALQTS